MKLPNRSGGVLLGGVSFVVRSYGKRQNHGFCYDWSSLFCFVLCYSCDGVLFVGFMCCLVSRKCSLVVAGVTVEE